MTRPPWASSEGVWVWRGRSRPSNSWYAVTWLPAALSVLVNTKLGALSDSVYPYSRSGRVVDGVLWGLNTLTSRPSPSYCRVVVFRLGSTTVTGWPRVPSSAVVTTWPAGLVTVVPVTGPPVVGV